jgi:mRNA-decapping enzyme subunit 2
VLEETSFDISPYLNEQEYLEHTFNDQLSRLYIIPGVPRNTGFMPATRCEIKSIQWFPVDQLPCTKKDTTPKDKLGLGANSFFMIIPFMRRIRLWIEGKKAAANSKPQVNGRKQRLTSQGESDSRANNRKSAQVKSQQMLTLQTSSDGNAVIFCAGRKITIHKK